MIEFTIAIDEEPLTLDVCRACEFVWFDAGKLESLAPHAPPPHVLGELELDKMSPEMREKLAMTEVEMIAKRDPAYNEPDQDWKTLPAILGLPVELDSEPMARLPWATYLLALTIAAVSLAAFRDLRHVVDNYGLLPSQPMRHYGLTFITSFFIHGGVIHLLSNLYFLLVFGRRVESDLGPWRWLLLVFLATQIGNLVELIGEFRDLPSIGASGGISGLLAYYALKYPKARVGMIFRFYLFIRWIPFSASTLFIIWILLQIWGAYDQVAGFSNIASLAHLGGGFAGFGFWWMMRAAKMPPVVEPGRINIKVS
jgi:membrane associated rhomboid family serine protease